MTKEKRSLKRKVTFGIMATLLLIGMLTLAFSTQSAKAEPTTIFVPDDYEKIQWAVGNASAGDTVFVRAGTYFEHVVVDKTVSLIGEDRETTILDGSGTGTVVTVTADNVVINGFTVQNARAGIHLRVHVRNNTIAGNTVSKNDNGISLSWSSNNTISGNTISYNGNGIKFSSSHNNAIYGNYISNNKCGINLELSPYHGPPISSGNRIYGNNLAWNECHIVGNKRVNTIQFWMGLGWGVLITIAGAATMAVVVCIKKGREIISANLKAKLIGKAMFLYCIVAFTLLAPLWLFALIVPFGLSLLLILPFAYLTAAIIGGIVVGNWARKGTVWGCVNGLLLGFMGGLMLSTLIVTCSSQIIVLDDLLKNVLIPSSLVGLVGGLLGGLTSSRPTPRGIPSRTHVWVLGFWGLNY